MIEPLSENEQNIITQVLNVSKYSLDTCIKTIRNANNDVFFSRIQYLEEEQIVIFYTNKEINVKKWEDKNSIKDKYINNELETLKEIRKILLSRENNDSYCTSIYDIIDSLKEKNMEYTRLKRYYKEKIEKIVHSKIMKGLNIMVDIDDCYKNIICISINNNPYSKKQDICFFKEDNELTVINEKTFSSLERKILDEIKDILLELYDEFMDFFAFNKQSKVDISTINASFLVNINSNLIEVFTDDIIIRETVDLLKNNHDNEIEGISSYVTKLLSNNKEELLKKMFIKIDDCPRWMQDKLYTKRQEQLKENRIINNKLNFKQKILLLIRK